MKSIYAAIFALATVATAQDTANPNSAVVVTITPGANPPPTTTQTGCPTVTETRELCGTCPVPACLGLATVTQSCGCPSVVPTVYLDFPCSASCAGVWCTTSYDIVTATGACVSGGVGGPAPTPTGAVPTAGGGVNGTLTTTRAPTSSVVQVNGVGRMGVPRVFGWLWFW